jgi:hypothetical protein
MMAVGVIILGGEGVIMAAVPACEPRTGSSIEILRDYLPKLEQSYRELSLGVSAGSWAANVQRGCTRRLVSLIVDECDLGRDLALYNTLLGALLTEYHQKPEALIALTELGYALQGRWEALVMPRYYAEQAFKQERRMRLSDFGFAAGTIWSLKTTPNEAVSALALVRTTLQGGTALVASTGASKILTSGGDVVLPPPNRILPFASAINSDSVDEVASAAYYREIAARTMGVVAAVGIVRGGAAITARVAPHPLVKLGSLALTVPLAWWADSMIRDVANAVSDTQMRRILDNTLKTEARTLYEEMRPGASQPSAPGTTGAAERKALEHIHALLEAALRLSALDSFVQARNRSVSKDPTSVHMLAHDIELGTGKYDVPDEIAHYLARSTMASRLAAGEDLMNALFSPSNPLDQASLDELARFRRSGGTRPLALLQYLLDKDSDDERTLSLDLLNGVIRPGRGVALLQVRALLKSFERPFFSLYIETVLEPRIARIGVGADLAGPLPVLSSGRQP